MYRTSLTHRNPKTAAGGETIRSKKGPAKTREEGENSWRRGGEQLEKRGRTAGEEGENGWRRGENGRVFERVLLVFSAGISSSVVNQQLVIRMNFGVLLQAADKKERQNFSSCFFMFSSWLFSFYFKPPLSSSSCLKLCFSSLGTSGRILLCFCDLFLFFLFTLFLADAPSFSVFGFSSLSLKVVEKQRA